MFRSHVVSAVWKRNVSSYFSGVLGYLFIAVFVVAASMLAFNDKFFVENQCNLDQLSASFPWLLLFIIPAVTMTLWADERKQGTDELLFTLPARDYEILIGKYLAALTIYTIALAFSGSLTLVLQYLGNPDWSTLLSTYFGYWIAGAALLAAGMFASVLTSSATVAFILGVLFAALPVALDWIGLDQIFNQNGIRESLSVPGNLRDFTIGVIPIGGVVYFVAMGLFFLYLNSVMIARRHWAGGKHGTMMGWQFVVRALCLGVILMSGTYVLALMSGRIDMTSEKLYTLSEASRSAVAKIDPKHPVLLQAYVSPDVPEEYVAVRKNLMSLLKEFQKLGGSKIDMRIVDTPPFSKQAEEASAGGIERRETVSERGGRFTRADVYMGVSVSSGYDRVVIPYFEKGTPVELELTRAIGTVAKEKRPTIGVLATDARVFGGLDQQTFQEAPEWRIVTELKKQYNVKEISAREEIKDDSCDVLLAIMPSSLEQAEMDNLVAFVKRGRPTLIFDDPVPFFVDQTLGIAPSNPNKPGTGGGFMGMGGQPGAPKADGGEATSLMDALGVSWNVRDVVYDFYNPHTDFGDQYPKALLFTTSMGGDTLLAETSGLNPHQPITKGLQEIWLWFSGEVKPKADSKFDFIPLIRSTQGRSGVVDYDKAALPSGGPFGGGARRLNPAIGQAENPDRNQHVLAAYIRPADKKATDGVNAIVVADADIVHDTMFYVSEQEYRGAKIDNVAFVMNCIDTLAGNFDYVPLRNRRAIQRNLTKLDAEQEAFQQSTQKAVAEAQKTAEDQIAAAQKRMGEGLQKIESNTSMDEVSKMRAMSELQSNEQRKLTLETKQIRREADDKILKAKRDAEERKTAIESRVKFFAWGLPPIPAIILGVLMYGRRRLEERRGVATERLVKKD